MIGDQRGVSPVFGYVLTLGISTLLVSGLLIAAGGFVDQQRELTSESELRVIGQQVSADIAAADRLARTDGASRINVTRTIPEQVVGSQYSIEVKTDANGPTQPYLQLRTVRPNVTAVVGVTNETVLVESRVSGGEIEVFYDESADELEVRNAE